MALRARDSGGLERSLCAAPPSPGVCVGAGLGLARPPRPLAGLCSTSVPAASPSLVSARRQVLRVTVAGATMMPCVVWVGVTRQPCVRRLVLCGCPVVARRRGPCGPSEPQRSTCRGPE